MNLSPKLIILINGAILFLVVLWLLSAKKRLKPTKLKMKNGPTNKVPANQGEDSISARARSEVMNFEKAQKPTAKGQWSSSKAQNEPRAPQYQKELNVVFNFNGHTFDAFEVLGLPAGSSVDKARLAHREMKSKIDPESVALVDAALQAILRSR